MISVPPSGPFFLSIGSDQRFCYFDAPTVPLRGCVLAVPPFAEELNKCRATMADGARALAEAGFGVLRMDLLGCGDSSGDHADATWAQWLADLAVAWEWLAARCGGPRWVWGTRMGSLLAEQFVARATPVADGLLLWQPVVSGAQHLGQFLRLKTVGNLLRQSGASAAAGSAGVAAASIAEALSPRGPAIAGVEAAPSVAPSPRSELAAGRTVEIAGYHLTPALADALESARMGVTSPPAGRVVWLEVTAPAAASETSNVSAIAARVADGWRAAGSDVVQSTVAGAQFWQTLEVMRCPALVAATVDECCR